MTIRIYEKWSGWLQIRQGLDNFIVFYIYFYCNSSADMSELCSLSDGRNAQMELHF